MGINIITFLILLCIPLSINLKCNAGTLACDNSQEIPVPILCDFMDSYVLSKDKTECEKQETIENCAVPSLPGSSFDCSQCNDGYFYDQSVKKCSKILIANCVKASSSNSSCFQCSSNFYMKQDACVEVGDSKIPNCLSYSAKTTCSQCQSNYYLSQGLCKKMTRTVTCKSYRQIECLECKPEHYRSYSADPEFYKSFSSHGKELIELSNNNHVFRNNFLSETCLEGLVEHCQSYLSKKICGKCKLGFVLAENGTRCQSNENYVGIIGCEVPGENDTCDKCSEGFNLNQSGHTCTPDNTEHCEEINEETKICVKCNSDYILKANNCNTKRTVTLEEINCEEFELTSDKCKTCKVNHISRKDQLKCLPTIPNCMEHNTDTTSEERFLCMKCKATHHLDGGGTTCVAGNLPNCVEYAEASNLCEKCSPLFFLREGKCNDPRTESVIDVNCQSNSSPNTSACQDCKENYFVMDGAHSVNFEEQFQGCDEVNRFTMKCSDCGPMKYINNNTFSCEARTTPSKDGVPNCNKFALNQDKCLVCASGFYPLISKTTQPKGSSSCLKGGDVSGFPIDNCHIFNPNISGCSQCYEGFRVDPEDSSKCLVGSDNLEIAFDMNMQRTSMAISPIIENCKQYFQINQNEIVCTTCKDPYIKVVDVHKSTVNHTLIFNTENPSNKGTPWSLSLAVKSCSKSEMFLKFDNSEDDSFMIVLGNISDSCKIGIGEADSTDYRCIKCREGNSGKVVKYTHYNNETPIPTPYYGVAKCDSPAIPEMDNKFVWQEFQIGKVAEELPYSIYLESTRCKDPSKILVFQASVDTNGKVTFIDIGNVFSSSSVLTCLNITGGELEFYNVTFAKANENCQIFATDMAEVKDKFVVNICMACKPGYTPVYIANTRRIQSCQLIPFCKTSESVFLNGCSSPEFGFNLDSEANNSLIMLHSPRETPGPVLNCLVFAAGNNECVLCEAFFNLVSNQCVAVENTIDDCSQQAYQMTHALNWAKTDSSVNLRLVNYYFFMHTFLHLANNKVGFCIECESGYIVTSEADISPGPSLDVCVDQNTLADKTVLVEDCLLYETSSASCSQCVAGKVYDVQSKLCEESPELPGCLTKNGIKCVSCAESMALDDNDKCVTDNCEFTFHDRCSLCKENFKFVEDNMERCVPNDDPDDVCAAYSPRLQTCGRCKAGTLIIFNDKSINKVQSFSCEDSSIDFQANGWSEYGALEAPLIQVDMVNSEVVGVRFNFLNIGFNKSMQFNNSPDKNPSVSHCFPFRNVPNCRPGKFQRGVFCAQCDTGYYLTSSANLCEKGGINGCDVYKSQDVCESCKLESFWLNGNQCEGRTIIEGCATFEPGADLCNTCKDNYIDKGNGVCELDFSGNSSCEELNDAACVRCIPGYYLTEGACQKVLAPIMNCLRYLNKDTCVQCKTQYLKSQDGKKCQLSELRNCVEVLDLNTCKKCEQNFIRKVEKVETRDEDQETVTVTRVSCAYSQIERCVVPIGGSPAICLECEKSWMPSGDMQTCVRSDTITNCMEYQSPSQCVKCRDGFVRSIDWSSCDESASREFTGKCSSLGVNRKLVCEQCQRGFRKDSENNCVACSKGCSICVGRTAEDGKETSTCSLCDFGYNMDEALRCNPVRKLVQNHVHILSVLTLGLISFMFLLK